MYTPFQSRMSASSSLDYQPHQAFTTRSPYGYSPPYVTPQTQLRQISPLYVMPSPDNTQQIAEALA